MVKFHILPDTACIIANLNPAHQGGHDAKAQLQENL